MGRYPTDYLRVKIVLKALKVMGFETEAVEYEDFWRNYKSKMAAEYTNDIEQIVPALLEGTHQMLGGKSVMNVFCFSSEQQENVNKAVDKFTKTAADTTIKDLPTDICVLFAAVRCAFEKTPAEYKTKNYAGVVLTHIKEKVVTPGVRSGEEKLKGNALENKLNAQTRAGADWADEMLLSL